MSSMTAPEFVSEEVRAGGVGLRGSVLNMKNAVVAFFWEGGEMRLGTLSVAIPGGVSSTIMGVRDSIIGRMLAERIAERVGKVAVVSVYLKTVSVDVAGKPLLELSSRLLSKLGGGVEP